MALFKHNALESFVDDVEGKKFENSLQSNLWFTAALGVIPALSVGWAANSPVVGAIIYMSFVLALGIYAVGVPIALIARQILIELRAIRGAPGRFDYEA